MGRPQAGIEIDALIVAYSAGASIRTLALRLGISRETVRRRLHEYGARVRRVGCASTLAQYRPGLHAAASTAARHAAPVGRQVSLKSFGARAPVQVPTDSPEIADGALDDDFAL